MVGGVVDFADFHFDKVGAQKATGGQISAARVDFDDTGEHFVEPDGIFGLSIDGNRVVYALEMHRFPDTGRIADQLVKHGQILMHGAISKKYGETKSNLVLSVHDTQRTLKKVRERLLSYQNFYPYRKGFIFNSLEQVKTDISEGWTLADGTPFNPFPRLKRRSKIEVRATDTASSSLKST